MVTAGESPFSNFNPNDASELVGLDAHSSHVRGFAGRDFGGDQVPRRITGDERDDRTVPAGCGRESPDRSRERRIGSMTDRARLRRPRKGGAADADNCRKPRTTSARSAE